MKTKAPVGSIFSEELDHAICLTYFLGSVVPLLALAWTMSRYALPIAEHEAFATGGMVALIVSVGAVSLTSFLALRRIIHTTLAGSQPERTEASSPSTSAAVETGNAQPVHASPSETHDVQA
jgi:hypothetical protein